MAGNELVRTIWSDDKQDLIVADYFDMLTEELVGRPYVKTRYRKALMAQLWRFMRARP